MTFIILAKTILLTEVNDTTLKKEGFHISTTGNLTRVSGRDGSGVIYGCRELIDRVNDSDCLLYTSRCV